MTANSPKTFSLFFRHYRCPRVRVGEISKKAVLNREPSLNTPRQRFRLPASNHDVVATVGYSDGIQVYDVTSTGATQRLPTVSLVNNVYEESVLAWGSSSDLYSNDEGLSPSSFHRFTVGPTSFAETAPTCLDAIGGKITYSGGLVFSDGGGVLDPSPVPPVTPRLVGRFANAGSSAADTSINRVFFLSQNSYNVNSRTISTLDATRFTPIGSMELDGLSGDARTIRAALFLESESSSVSFHNISQRRSCARREHLGDHYRATIRDWVYCEVERLGAYHCVY